MNTSQVPNIRVMPLVMLACDDYYAKMHHYRLQGYRWEDPGREWIESIDAEEWLYHLDNLWIDKFAYNIHKKEHQSCVRRRKWRRVAVDTMRGARGCAATRGCAVKACMIQ